MTTYKITLFDGLWGNALTRERIIDCLKSALHGKSDSVAAVRIRQPFVYEEDGICHVVHVDVDCGVDTDEEIVGDFLFEALLSRLHPEYDTLIEVENVESLSV